MMEPILPCDRLLAAEEHASNGLDGVNPPHKCYKMKQSTGWNESFRRRPPCEDHQQQWCPRVLHVPMSTVGRFHMLPGSYCSRRRYSGSQGHCLPGDLQRQIRALTADDRADIRQHIIIDDVTMRVKFQSDGRHLLRRRTPGGFAGPHTCPL